MCWRKRFFCKKNLCNSCTTKMKRKWKNQSLWTPLSLWNYFKKWSKWSCYLCLFLVWFIQSFFHWLCVPLEQVLKGHTNHFCDNYFLTLILRFLGQVFMVQTFRCLNILGSCWNWADKESLRLRGFGFEKYGNFLGENLLVEKKFQSWGMICNWIFLLQNELGFLARRCRYSYRQCFWSPR